MLHSANTNFRFLIISPKFHVTTKSLLGGQRLDFDYMNLQISSSQ